MYFTNHRRSFVIHESITLRLRVKPVFNLVGVSVTSMASVVTRLSRATRLLPRLPSRQPIHVYCGKRYVATSSCLRYQGTYAKSQVSEVPVDKYQRTTITEDIQRAAGPESWDDPRSANKVNLDHSSGESMIDPTIRHFTVNFV
jgi:hypothetical protein